MLLPRSPASIRKLFSMGEKKNGGEGFYLGTTKGPAPFRVPNADFFYI
jgi:hypothetical protein